MFINMLIIIYYFLLINQLIQYYLILINENLIQI